MRGVMNQEIMQMLGQMNQQHEALQEQIKIVDQQLVELGQFGEELSALEEHKNETVITSLGKSVFAPVKLMPDEKMFVEVGAGYFVRKDINGTKIVVEEQNKRLHEFKNNLSSELDNLTMQLENVLKMQHA